MSAPLVLLDGASMWFRSYFGVPSSITAPDGTAGQRAARLPRRRRHGGHPRPPGRLVVCRDCDWRPQWRVDLIPSYKAHRVEQETAGERPDVEEVPDELTPQVDMIVEILDAFGIPTGGAPGFEADDVLGTLAAQETPDPVIVVSGDRDLLQLVARRARRGQRALPGQRAGQGDQVGTRTRSPRNTAFPLDRAGPAYAELALLRGDPSDGLPGVPGIGEKTAATLLAQHGSLEAILAAAARPEIDDVQGVSHETPGGGRLHRGGRPGGAGGHRRDRSPCRPRSTRCRWPPRIRARWPSWPTSYGVTSSIGRLQKALDGLPDA